MPVVTLESPIGPLHVIADEQCIARFGFGPANQPDDISRDIDGNPRAVGQACGRNPIPLIVPCHRVLGSGGWVDGFSGGDGRTIQASSARTRSEYHLCLDALTP